MTQIMKLLPLFPEENREEILKNQRTVQVDKPHYPRDCKTIYRQERVKCNGFDPLILVFYIDKIFGSKVLSHSIIKKETKHQQP